MPDNAEARAREVLAELADELADNPRVRKVIDDAVQKLAGRPCRPHWWKTPEIGDDELTCAECGRSMRFSEINSDVRASVVNGYERRHGREAGRAFSEAYFAADRDHSDRIGFNKNRYQSAEAAMPRRSFDDEAAERRRKLYGG